MSFFSGVSKAVHDKKVKELNNTIKGLKSQHTKKLNEVNKEVKELKNEIKKLKAQHTKQMKEKEKIMKEDQKAMEKTLKNEIKGLKSQLTKKTNNFKVQKAAITSAARKKVTNANKRKRDALDVKSAVLASKKPRTTFVSTFCDF